MGKLKRGVGRHLQEFVFMVRGQEVERLLAISARLRPLDARAVNMAIVVFLMAIWQTYAKVIAELAFEKLVEQSASHDAIPSRVRVLASERLRASKDERAIWSLAGSGWRAVLNSHMEATLQKLAGSFSTPSADAIDNLFEALLGMRGISEHWKWRGMTSPRARRKLGEILALRHDIAHTARARAPLERSTVVGYSHFVHRPAVCLHNATALHLARVIGRQVWSRMQYRGKFGELSMPLPARPIRNHRRRRAL